MYKEDNNKDKDKDKTIEMSLSDEYPQDLKRIIKKTIKEKSSKGIFNFNKVLTAVNAELKKTRNNDEVEEFEEESDHEEELKIMTIETIAHNIINEYPKGIQSFIEEHPPKETDTYYIMVFNCPLKFYEKYAYEGIVNRGIDSATNVFIKENPAEISIGVTDKHRTLNFDDPKIEYDYDVRMSRTEKYLKLISIVFEDLMLLEKVVDIHCKESHNLLMKTNPQNFYNHPKIMERLKRSYFEFNYEDFLLVFLRMLKFFTHLNIKLDLTPDSKVLLKFFGDEHILNVLAETFEYELQLKPYALFYSELSKKIAQDNINQNEKTFDDEQRLLIDENLLPNLQFWQLDFDDPKHFPPYYHYEVEHDSKFRRYENNDLNHTCPHDKEMRIKLIEEKNERNERNTNNSYINERKSDRKRDCCTKYRTTDKLRLIYRTLDVFIRFNVLNYYDILDTHCFKRNAIGNSDQISSKALFKDSFNIFDNKAQLTFLNTTRNFYGEKFSFYFLYLIHLGKWLLFPSLLGIVMFIFFLNFPNTAKEGHLQFITRDVILNYEDITYFVFCFIITVWATMFLKIWQQKQRMYAFFWGMEHFKVNEPNREEFSPDKKEEFMFDHSISYQSPWKNATKIFVSYIIVLFLIILTIFIVFLLFYWRAMKTDFGTDTSLFYPIIVASINGVQIKIMSYIYEFIARKLTEWENHEKYSQFENALAIKLIMFEFINNFISLYYIGFFKRSIESCKYDDCFVDVNVQLYFILFASLLFKVLEIFFPILKYKIRQRNYLKKIQKNKPYPNKKFPAHSYEHQLLCDEVNTLIYDYNDLMIYFGYVTFFSVAAPLTPLIVFLLVYLEKFVDSYKFYKIMRVNIVEGATGIEIYNTILKVFYFIGMLTNIALVLFANRHLIGLKLFYKLGIFAALENFVFLLMIILNWNITPKWFEHISLMKALYNRKFYNKDRETLPHVSLLSKLQKDYKKDEFNLDKVIKEGAIEEEEEKQMKDDNN